MSLSKHAAQSLENYEAKKYWTSRGFHDSARLHLQQWLFQRQFGFLLHPSIPQDKPDLSIADIGCGNGAWLLELASKHPYTSLLDGFDLSADNFPAKEWLPENVELHVLDVLGKISDHLVGAFDIIQVRAFITIIKHGDTAPLLTAISKMLKPGGYFQWIEADLALFAAIAPNQEISKVNCDRLVKLHAEWAKKSGTDCEFLYEMPARLQAYGFKIVDERTHKILPELYKGWNDNLLQVFEEVAGSLPTVAERGTDQEEGMTREEYQELFPRVLRETQNGVAINMQELLVVVAQKEEWHDERRRDGSN